jgi:hypothetical protein
LAVSTFIEVAKGFAVANKKDSHQPSRCKGLGVTATMDASRTIGNPVGIGEASICILILNPSRPE